MVSEAASPPAIAELVGGDEDAVVRLYETVLAPSFPDDELVTLDDLLGTWHDGNCRISVARGPDGAILAAAVGDWFPRSRVQLLSYLAVRPGLRGRGVGGTLMAAAIARWVEDLFPLLVVGEVEDPRYAAVHGDLSAPHGDAAARLRFYERLGVRSLPVPYCQPALRPSSARVPHLLLMIFAADKAARPAPDRIEGSMVEAFLSEYFAATEGPSREDDTELAAMLAACRRPGGMPLLTVDDLEAAGMAAQ